MIRSLTLALVALTGLAACGAGFRERFEAQELPKLRERASFDLSCPKEQLQLTELGSMATQGVTGCGQKATYVQGRSGQWIQNTDSQPASSAPAAKAAPSQ